MFFDEWFDATSPTDEVDLTMMVNHRMYVLWRIGTEQVDPTRYDLLERSVLIACPVITWQSRTGHDLPYVHAGLFCATVGRPKRRPWHISNIWAFDGRYLRMPPLSATAERRPLFYLIRLL
jgi:hypothetical protein